MSSEENESHHKKCSFLLNWCSEQTSSYCNISVTDFRDSWEDGMAICAILHKHFPDSIDFYSLSPSDREKNFKLAFDVAKTQLGITETFDANILTDSSIIEFISALHNALHDAPVSLSKEPDERKMDVLQSVSVENLCGNEISKNLESVSSSTDTRPDIKISRDSLRKLDELKTQCENLLHGLSESVETESPVATSSSISRSPSPIRISVSSPYAVATMLPSSEDRKIPPARPPPPVTENASKRRVIRTPFDDDVLKENEELISASCKGSGEAKSYPDHLNPFSDDDDDDLKVENSQLTTEVCSEKTSFAIDPVNNTHEAIFRNSYDVNSLCDRLSLAKLSDSTATTPVLRRRSRKKVAPTHPDSSYSPAIHRRENGNISDSYSKARSSSASRMRTYITQSRASHLETRSMILKRPAPPIPVPPKRTIKSVMNCGQINYTEVHEKLYTVNSKITELEHRARGLQRQIATTSKEKVNRLMKQWVQLTDQKDELFNEQRKLLQRLRCHELDEQHSDLEYELRTLLAKQDHLKTAVERAREAELLDRLVNTVNQRAELVEDNDDRLPTGHEKSCKSKVKKLMCVRNVQSLWQERKQRRQLKHRFPSLPSFCLSRPVKKPD